jgi:hypothetical protein
MRNSQTNNKKGHQGFPRGIRSEKHFLEYMDDYFVVGDVVEQHLKNYYRDYRVPVKTARRWWNHYLNWGETPTETRRVIRKINKLARRHKTTSLVTNRVIFTVKEIVDENPELYLDEIATELANRMDVYVSISTIHRILKNHIGYSLQVYTEAAAQRDEVERLRYKAALQALVQNPEQVVFIDETHKDRNSSRRRRAWGRRNSGGLVLRR